MKVQTVDKLIWTLVYGGLAGIALGLSIARSDSPLGTAVAVAGGIVAIAGAVLIWVRSRMKESE